MTKKPKISPLAEQACTLFPSGRGTGGPSYFCHPPPPPCCRPSMTSISLAHHRDQAVRASVLPACTHSPTLWLRSALRLLLALPIVFPLLFPKLTCIPHVSHQVPSSASWERTHQHHGSAFGVAEWKHSVLLGAVCIESFESMRGNLPSIAKESLGCVAGTKHLLLTALKESGFPLFFKESGFLGEVGI